MDGDLYDEFGNYVGPELDSDESEGEEEKEGYGGEREEEEEVRTLGGQVVHHRFYGVLSVAGSGRGR